MHRVTGRDGRLRQLAWFWGLGEGRKRLSRHQAGGDGGNRAVGGLGNEGHGARGARVHFDQVDVFAFDRELDVHQADDVESEGQCLGLVDQFVDDRVRQRVGRKRAGAVARVHACLFDVLHDARHMDVLTVAKRVNIDLGRTI